MTHPLRFRYLPVFLMLGLNITGLAVAQEKGDVKSHKKGDCSFTHTNKSCTLTLDRNSFVFPPTLQMYLDAVVTVKIRNGHNFEAYTLDQVAGQATVRPDVASAALGNLNTILAAATSFGAANTTPAPLVATALGEQVASGETPPPLEGVKAHIAKKVDKNDPCEQDSQGIACRREKENELLGIILKALQQEKKAADDATTAAAAKAAQDQKNAIDQSIQYCADPNYLSQFSTPECMMLALRGASHAILGAAILPSQKLYRELQGFLTPDAQPVPPLPFALGDLLVELCGRSAGPGVNLPCALESGSDSVIHLQADASAYAGAVLAKLAKPPSSLAGRITAPAKFDPLRQDVLNAMQLVTEEQAALDAVRKDLEGYASRIQDLLNHPVVASGIIGSGDPNANPQEVGEIRDYGKTFHVTHSLNYSLNRLNLVTNSLEAANDGSKKALIVTINVVYGETRWEASSGVALAYRPIRTFSVGSVISSAGEVTSQYIAQSKAGPEVVPFAAADFRVAPDFNFGGWRGAFYLTGGVGYNTSQVSADYLAGPSISWRGVLFSALCDWGNAPRLAQGLTVGQSLGTPATSTTPFVPTTITTLPTTNHIVPAFTIGISVRIPSIAGR